MGYIVPADAPSPAKDPAGFVAKALDLQMIDVYSKRIQAKHALFLFDSCFSGSLMASTRAIPADISYKAAQPVRQYITSGSEGEEVPDESIFRSLFVAALQGEADLNGDGYLTGTELSSFLTDNVINYSQRQPAPPVREDPSPEPGQGRFRVPVRQSPRTAARPSGRQTRPRRRPRRRLTGRPSRRRARRGRPP